VQLLHEFNIKRLQAMPEWRNKVEAAMNPVIGNIPTVKTPLSMEELLKLVIYVLYDGLEAVSIVNGVSEPRRINDRQPQLDPTFFNLDSLGINSHVLLVPLC
jgi:hypothetical protein